MTSCAICCDNYNKSTRSKIACPYCAFEVCRTCCETYMLTETTAKCMNPECAKEWTRKFLREQFTNTFLTTKYKDHIENVLFDQEKSLLPSTQPLVEERKIKAVLTKQIQDVDVFIDDLTKQKRKISHTFPFEKQKYKDLCSLIIDMNRHVRELKQLRNNTTTSTYNDRAKFVRQCPADGCRGFLSTQWKCGICDQWACPECHEVKGPHRDCDHTCDPNNVASAQLLAKDSKPCPKCQSLIFKIEGCNQMWCTQCHTAFNWQTGKLETNIHNPHFFEWQRMNNRGVAPRNPHDIECGRNLSYETVTLLFAAVHRHDNLYFKITTPEDYYYDNNILRVEDIIRSCVHNTYQELPKFQTNYVERNQELRIQYLESSISLDGFKTLIQRNDKKNKKNNEIAEILRLANTAVTDIVYRLIDHLTQASSCAHQVPAFMGELDAIIQYCNDIFKDISFTYHTVQYQLSDKFKLERVKKVFKTSKANMGEDWTDGQG